ncbi:hypothetical protein FM109_04225 [Vibrio casei]|nr:hypothetical protein FM109_04225 [Vibrio casei]
MYHEPESWDLWNKGVIEDYESSTGIFITASSIADAIKWAEIIGEKLLRFVNSDNSLSYSKLNYECWHEPDIKESGWDHCLSHFQHVKVGEMPNLKNMTTESYEKWQSENT